MTYYIPSSLRTVIITDETKIGYGAFRNCKGLTSVVLPNSVRDIGDYSFEYCSDLESIRLPEVLDQSVGSKSNTLGYASFRYCSSLINVAIPHGIISTRGPQFKDCVNLENVVFPDSITGLGGQSFSGCASLKSMSFPKGVTLIGEKAFYNCTSLSTIVFKGNAPEVDADGFTGVPSSCCTYVRKDSAGWNVDIQGRWKGLLIDYSHYNVSFNANGGEGAMAATWARRRN